MVGDGHPGKELASGDGSDLGDGDSGRREGEEGRDGGDEGCEKGGGGGVGVGDTGQGLRWVGVTVVGEGGWKWSG